MLPRWWLVLIAVCALCVVGSSASADGPREPSGMFHESPLPELEPPSIPELDLENVSAEPPELPDGPFSEQGLSPKELPVGLPVPPGGPSEPAPGDDAGAPGEHENQTAPDAEETLEAVFAQVPELPDLDPLLGTLPPLPDAPGAPPLPSEASPTPTPVAGDPPPPEAAPSPATSAAGWSAAEPRSVAAASAAVALAVAGAAPLAAHAASPWLARVLLSLRLGLLALYARVAGERVLDHSTRSDIVTFVRAHPGACLTEIHDAFPVGLTTIRYHLRVLEANHLVTGLKSGRRRCYFATADGHSRDERMALATLSSAAVRRVYHEIRRQPGIRQKELAALLEVSPTSVIFHARRLEAAGVVARGRHGRETAYYPVVNSA